MEDLLDDERIRQKISELEETARQEANAVIKKQLTNVLGASSYTKLFGTAYDGAKGTAAGTAATATAPAAGAALFGSIGSIGSIVANAVPTNAVPTTSPLVAQTTNILGLGSIM